MKKLQYLPILFVAVFLMLCACAQTTTEQPETTPTTIPSPIPTTVPTEPTTIPTQPTTAPTQPTTAPTQPTAAPTQPTTAPTQPTTKPTPPPTEPNWDWVTNREIVPFEERFVEDVPYINTRYWIDEHEKWSSYGMYYFDEPYISVQYGLMVPAEIVWKHSFETEHLYQIPTDHRFLLEYNQISADGRWAYMTNGQALIRLNLLTGELDTLATHNENDLRWEVKACSKDTVCIFQLDAQRNLRVYYRDLHSDAERTLYQGVLPDVPTSKDHLIFHAPATTQGQAYWEMINPAFYEVYLNELNNPNSSLKNAADFYKAVQDHYDIPMLVRYSCDFFTGTLTEDFGLYDTCWNTADCKHDHWNYENTREEVPTVLDVSPVEIPDIAKPEGDAIWYEVDTALTDIYSEFGYGQPYVILDSYRGKLADFAVTDSEISSHFAFFITTEGTIVQFKYNNTNYNTIYSSENELSELFWCKDYLYFVDGDTIVCIDLVAGTYRPIIQTTLDEIYIVGEEYIYYPHDLYFGVRQGMYYQEYRYDMETNTFVEDVFVP